MNEKKILNNIEPFNDFYYKNCFYNSFFPVVTHFNRSILPFLINNIVTYKNEHLNGRVFLCAKYIGCRSESEILTDIGICYLTKLKCENIIGDIKNSILNERPVIIWVDCFYEPIRKDTYLKQHLAHTWLIYGYDDTCSKLHIIEHRERENLSYQKYTINYQDAINCYQGYIFNYQPKCEPSYYEYYLKDPCTTYSNVDMGNNNEDMSIFIHTMLCNKDAIIRDLNYVKLFIDDFKSIVMHEKVLLANAEEFLNKFNNTINCKQSENYKLFILLSNEPELVNKINTIFSLWKFIRAKMAKFLYTAVYNQDVFQLMVDKLEELLNLEQQFYIKLYSYFDKIKANKLEV